ncbi:hypothetical protein H4219_003192 [Mycoemilia scoparia]|uniref:Uncharacterized protein n=1 Tax=Mycoemilia scoparia TaxID=417184 RepID=A0A9W7ZZD6_9FUNG|nr:hypothetical protein H4219_003192 [Mycoemilia scoparia]
MSKSLPKEMKAEINTLIKLTIKNHGPQTLRQLYHNLLRTFPTQCSELTYSQYKAKHIKNLKNFGHLIIKPERNQEVLKELAKNPVETRVSASMKEAWMVRLHPSIEELYKAKEEAGHPVDPEKSYKTIVSKIEEERSKSKGFWEGKTNKPHDWKAALKAVGHPTSL